MSNLLAGPAGSQPKHWDFLREFTIYHYPFIVMANCDEEAPDLFKQSI